MAATGKHPQERLPPGERIAKAMARAGLCSRREAEAWIAAGRVAVNGAVIASPALNVTAADRITVDGEAAAAARAHAAVPLSQAARPGDHACRSAGPPDRVRGAAETSAAADERRPARRQYRGPAAAHQRRRARARARTAGDRLAAPLSRARARPRAAGSARGAARRHHHRRRALRRRSRPSSTASRGRMSGSPSPCARASTAR